MALKVTKKDRENNSSLVHRFTRSVIQSGIIREARKRRFRLRPLSDTAKKRSALKREEKKVEYEKLAKMGKEKTKKW